jgi:hypothetical protein
MTNGQTEKKLDFYNHYYIDYLGYCAHSGFMLARP